MSNIEPRRRADAVNVGRVRPTASRVRIIEEQEQLTWLDRRLDERLESRHIVRVRDTRRDAEELATEVAGAAAVATAAVDARRKYLYEVKQQLRRAREESEMLAGGDMALMANFSQLDEDLYRDARMLGFDLFD